MSVLTFAELLREGTSPRDAEPPAGLLPHVTHHQHTRCNKIAEAAGRVGQEGRGGGGRGERWKMDHCSHG